MASPDLSESDSELSFDISLELFCEDFSVDEGESEEEVAADDPDFGNVPYRFEPYEDDEAPSTERREESQNDAGSDKDGDDEFDRLQHVEWLVDFIYTSIWENILFLVCASV